MSNDTNISNTTTTPLTAREKSRMMIDAVIDALTTARGSSDPKLAAANLATAAEMLDTARSYNNDAMKEDR